MFELCNNFKENSECIIYLYKYYILFFLSSCFFWGFTVNFWFFEDIFLFCPLILKLFFKNLEIITLAVFISFPWTWFPLDCKFVTGESFSSFRPNSCFLFYFIFFFSFPFSTKEVKFLWGWRGTSVHYIPFFHTRTTCTTRNTNCFWAESCCSIWRYSLKYLFISQW